MKYLFTSILIIVIGAIGFSLYSVGSPAKAREMQFDKQRVRDLEDIVYDMEDYHRRKKAMPETYQEMNTRKILDPKTKKPYAYRHLSESDYELCATFTYASRERAFEYDRLMYMGEEDNIHEYIYMHGAGEQCFQFELVKDSEGDDAYYYTEVKK
ncbi:MAG: hypothetical protein HOE80_03005 [Candidatus Magasanikbacteria bacterium]|jgi:hypothetical protein|nr:hypothetical protein [Candidatus Magasanikbacteria bacterium]MBT4071668.1 hypothetical protein [Candidatus Magasanikbacteria bacterium]